MNKADPNDRIWTIGHNMALFTAALDLTMDGIIVRMDYFLGDKAIIRIPGEICTMVLVKWAPESGSFPISMDEAANLAAFSFVFLCEGMNPQYFHKYQIPSSAIPEKCQKNITDENAYIKVEPEIFMQFRVDRFSCPIDTERN